MLANIGSKVNKNKITTRGIVLGLLIFFYSVKSFAYTEKQLLESRNDPSLDYRTLKTEHFDLHYPTLLEDPAHHIAARAEVSGRKVTQWLGVPFPGRTDLVLLDQTDRPANFTSIFPSSQISLDVVPPAESEGINEYQDFYDWVLTHEFTHTTHLQMRTGLYKPLASIFGPWMSPNMASPAWLKEGLAVYTESKLTPKGRGGGTEYRMVVRAAYADGILRSENFATLAKSANYEDKHWPWTLRPYLFGYSLVRTLIENSKADPSKIFQLSSGGFPFSMRGLLAYSPYRNFDELWEATLDTMERESAAEIKLLSTKPFTSLEFLSDTGEIYMGLTLSPDGKTLAVTRDNADEENAILKWEIQGDRFSGPEKIISRSTGDQIAFSRSSRFLIFDQISRSRRHYQISDLMIYDMKEHEWVSSSSNFRARDADFAPDETRVIFITNENGKNQLAESTTEWKNIGILYEPPGSIRLGRPRYSPDGKDIVFEMRNDKTGGQDILILEKGELSALVRDGANNTSPVWSHDGKYILYSSDRSGVNNIYAFELAKDRIFQISHTLGGLFSPNLDPKKKWVYAVAYRGKGYDVARFRWEPSQWIPIESKEAVPTEMTPATESTVTTPSVPYRGFSHLSPKYLSPTFAIYPYTYQIGAQTASVDPLFFHYYRLDARYDALSKSPVGEFFYFDSSSKNPWSLNIEHQETGRPGQVAGLLSGDITVNFPLSEITNDIYLRPGLVSSIPNRGTFDSTYSPAAGPHLGLRFDTRFKDIGIPFYESGTYIDLDLRHLISLTSNYSWSSATTYATANLEDHFGGFGKRHAVHLGAQGATVLAGNQSTYAYFSIAGYESFPLSGGNGYFLYGYSPSRGIGAQSIGIGNAAYTFPLWNIQHGFGTFPLYFSNLSMGVRSQIAGIEYPSAGGSFLWSYGAEFFQDVIAGQVFGFTMKLGFYNAPRSLGGDFQSILTIEASDL